MIETPRIVTLPACQTAVIHVACTREEIQQAMGQGVRDLMDGLKAQGLSPAGPLFTHHLRRPTDSFDFEIGVPVPQPVGPAGRIRPGEWPAMRVAQTVYRGRYEDLAGAWGEFKAWIASHDLALTQDLWESYVTGPEAGSDPTAWRTELNQPLQA